MKNKIILAFDSFKGSLTSLEAGEAAAEAVKEVLPEAVCEVVSLSDGGEGMTSSLLDKLGGERISVKVLSPTGKVIEATYGVNGDTAIIETASASGLTLVPVEERNPLLTSSYGTGQLIRDALERGYRKFLIGLGGSATNDAGLGLLKALGWRFTDSDGEELPEGGVALKRIAKINASGVIPGVFESTFTGACDVTNPLTGPNGASHVFGPQKGARPEDVERLDAALSRFAETVNRTEGQDFSQVPGAGAAGGIGFALLAFLGGTLRTGIDVVLDTIGFDSMLKDARLVFTGEGRLDAQTCMGKAPWGVLRRAARRDVPVIAVGGSLEPEAMEGLLKAGFSAAFPILAGPMDVATAMRPDVARAGIKRTVSQIIRLLNLSQAP